MGFSKTIYSLVGVLVAVIMIATVAMPAITSASTTTTTTTTTEIQDIEVSDPIYYKPYISKVQVEYSENVLSIQQYYNSVWTGYTLEGDFTSIPILVSDTVVSILYKDENKCYITTTGINPDNNKFASLEFEIYSSNRCTFEFTDYVKVMNESKYGGSSSGRSFTLPTWNYIVSIPEYGKGDYVTSTSQDTVTLGSLNEIVAGFASYTNMNDGDFAYIYNGEQTHNKDNELVINSVQTDAGNVDISLKASYGDTDVLILVPTTTEVNVMQTITVQSEYGPLLNVVLLMLLIVPVTAVAAMLYTRRD